MPDEGESPAGVFNAPEPSELTALLGGYEVRTLIACGGMGAVYCAEQLSLGREVAIKVLPRELAEDEEFRNSFEAEARAMAKLTHPNLIGVYDFGQIEGMLYLVMEYVHGDSLFAACHDQIVDPVQALEIVQGIASGLGHAHDAGIVHRDIKPANILISTDLVPKLGDFGLAVASDDVASGMVMGTPGFVAPEVLHDPEAASPASDVFALGALLHQLVTGVTPDWDAPPDMDLVPNLGALRAIVRKAVAPQPLMRYANGSEMAEALGEWLEKAKKGGMQLRTAEALPAGAFNTPVAAPVPAAGGGGFGMLSFVGLIVVALIGGGAWFAMQGEDDAEPILVAPPSKVPAVPVTPVKQPPPPEMAGTGKDQPGAQAPPESPSVLTPAAIKKKYLTLLAEVREEVIARRLENRNALEAAILNRPNWDPYFDLVDDDLQLLPQRYPGETRERINPNLITTYAIRNQERIYDDHYFAVAELNRDCLYELKQAGARLDPKVTRTWEAWVEWLGLAPIHVLAITLAGEWELDNGGPAAAVVSIGAQNEARVSLGEVEIFGEGVIETANDGEIRIVRAPDDPSKKWFLRWRDDKLVGLDETGAECTFVRRDPSLAANQIPGPDGNRKGSPGDGAGSQQSPPRITDPALLELKDKYLAAVQDQIAPLVKGYRGVLTGALALAERRDNGRSIDQLNTEIKRLDELKWKSGRVDLEEIDWDDEIPLSYQSKKSQFDRTFREKMDRLQTAYVEELRKLRAEFKGQRKDASQVELAIEQFELPPGTVRARYVKLVSLEMEGLRQAVISEFHILAADGNPLPQDSLTIHGVSSEQAARGENRAREAALVLDGRPGSFWHSQWAPERLPFPHWIAFDLQQAQVIRGFRLLPRQEEMRGGDILDWKLLTSLDGTKWREVAAGNFDRSRREQEFQFEP